MAKRILIWFESHLGAGDAQLVAALSRQLQAEGATVGIVSSSITRWQSIFDYGAAKFFPLPVIERRQDKHYYTPDGMRFEGSDYEQARAALLRQAFETFVPDTMITQGWPLTRQQFDHELTHLVQHNAQLPKSATLVAFPCDVVFINDWLVKQRPFDMTTMLDRFSQVLVPSDGMLDFCAPHPVLQAVQSKLRHAGYMVENTASANMSSGEVIVSSGGGWHDSDLVFYLSAIRAREGSAFAQHPWRVKVGRPACDEASYEMIQQAARLADPTGGICVEPADAQYKQQMAAADAVIIRGGYGMLMEAVRAERTIVSVPRPPKGIDQEQTARALALQTQGLVAHVTQQQCEDMIASDDYHVLSEALDAAQQRPRDAVLPRFSDEEALLALLETQQPASKIQSQGATIDHGVARGNSRIP